ncbi:hypothetical protein [Spirosoma sordidisoli]|uniref:Uncharacterized protein n=1 Tax=Spirosoma sordidisoli TaxID=2502893 RepID=A0A4Q2UPP2_9BACT|nr:hypothetical protein [Spirosoma sordidisoli]RYC69590.1 hypothetical protein EQG79_13385 [Spirosoma sordidisoli]
MQATDTDPLLLLLASRQLKLKVLGENLRYPTLLNNVVNGYKKPDKYKKYILDGQTRHTLLAFLAGIVAEFRALGKPSDTVAYADELRHFLDRPEMSVKTLLHDQLSPYEWGQWQTYQYNDRPAPPYEVVCKVHTILDKFVQSLETITKP